MTQWECSISENDADFENARTDVHEYHRTGRASTQRTEAKGARVEELISTTTEVIILVLAATLELCFGIVYGSANVCNSPISLVSKFLKLYQDEQNEMNLTRNGTALKWTSEM